MINHDLIVRDLFLIGASAGGIEALTRMLQPLPPDLPAAIGIVMHRNPSVAGYLDRVLGRATSLPLKEPTEGESIRPGHAYLAPRDFHLTVERGCWHLSRAAKVHFSRPAVDPLFISAARHGGNRAVGILLSGGGADGVEGFIAIKASGGLTIVQQPAEARYPSMPTSAIRDDSPDAVFRLEEIAAAIPLLAAGKAYDAARMA